MATRARRRVKKRTGWLVLLVIAALVAGGGTIYYTRTTSAPTEPEAPAMQTATVRKGDIVLTAVGSGNLMPAAELSLGFRNGGTLVALPVAVGDTVAAGQELARLDDAAAQLQVAQAELNLAQAQAKLATAQTSVSQTLEIAEANLAAVQADYDALIAEEASTGDKLTSVRVNLAQAYQNLADAQTAYDVAWDPGREWELSVQKTATALLNERDAATRALARAKDSVAVASAAYNLAAAGTADDSALRAAWAKLLDARRNVEDARSGAAVRDAGWSVQQAELALASAQLALDNTILRAPIAGTLTALLASPGEAVGTSPIITLVNVDVALVRFYLEESDLGSVVPGHAVIASFDAFPDRAFSGVVTRVDPALVTVDGTSAVQAWATLELENAPVSLPTGLTVEVEVIAGEAYKTLIVPVQALRELAPGQYAVFVVGEEGALRLRPVEVGLRDFANAQVLSGLEQGEIVSTGTVETE